MNNDKKKTRPIIKEPKKIESVGERMRNPKLYKHQNPFQYSEKVFDYYSDI